MRSPSACPRSAVQLGVKGSELRGLRVWDLWSLFWYWQYRGPGRQPGITGLSLSGGWGLEFGVGRKGASDPKKHQVRARGIGIIEGQEGGSGQGHAGEGTREQHCAFGNEGGVGPRRWGRRTFFRGEGCISEHGTNKTVTARIWPGLEPFSVRTSW